VLAWASDEGRVVLTHDISTMIGYARERVISGESMPGLIAVRTNRPIGLVIEDIEIVLLASESEEIDKRVLFIPL
jgi:hypothetical protein